MRLLFLLGALLVLALPSVAQPEATTPDLIVQIGHGVQVKSASFSPDGRSVVTAGMDGTARLWDAATGVELRRFLGHTDDVTTAAFSPNGRRIITASMDGTARVWDVATGDELRRLGGDSAAVSAAVFSPIGDRLATAGRDGTVRVWAGDTEDLRIGSLSGEALIAVSYSTDGRRLAAGAADGTVGVWDATTGAPLWEVLGHEGITQDVAFSPDGRRLATAGRDGAVRVWAAETGELERSIEAGAPLYAAVFSPDGRTIATASDMGDVGVWDAATGKPLMEIDRVGDWVNDVAFSPDGRHVVAATDSAAPLLDLDDLGRSFILGQRVSMKALFIRFASFSPDGRSLVTSTADGAVMIWDLASSAPTRIALPGDWMTHAAFSPDGRLLAVVTERGKVFVQDITEGLTTLVMDGHSSNVNHVAFSPDGRRVATAGGSDELVIVWDLATGREVQRLHIDPHGHSTTVQHVAFSPSGKTLATIAGGGTAQVWDLATGTETYRADAPVYAVRFGEDDTGLRITRQGDDAPVWADLTRTGAPMTEAAPETLTLGGRVRPEAGLSRTPDGRVAITQEVDLTFSLWDTRTGAQRGVVAPFADGSWLVVTPDGRFDAPDLEAVDGAVWVAPDDPLTPLPIEAFMADFYEPRLLSRVLSGEAFPDVGDLLDRNRVQPTVEVVSTEAAGDGTATVTVRVESRVREYGGARHASGAHDLRLFRDGKLVRWRDGELVAGEGAETVVFEGVPLPSNTDSIGFSAYAFNGDRVKSRTARTVLAVPASVVPRRPRRAFVVSLGVDAFDDPAWDLAFAAADARAYASALDSTLSASGDYHEVVAVALVSAHAEGASTDATAAALRGALLRLAGAPLDADAEAALARVPGADRLAVATPDDVVVVTASTHGYASPQGVFYLLPADVPTLPRGRALEAPAFLEAAVSSDELSAWLRGVDAGALAVVVDACNAAGAVEGSGFKPGPMGARGLGQLAFDKGAAVLTATQADAPALEASSTGRGLLTFALVENGLLAGQADGAGGGPGDPDGRITLAEWLAYGAQRVPELYEEVRAGEVETYGRGGTVRARSLPPDLAVGAENAAAGAQTPALFDFRKGARDVVLADD